jgi:uncharacterized protein (DUF1684 family)
MSVLDPGSELPELVYPGPLDVASWRREVHALYAAVRADGDPVSAHAVWVQGRSELFRSHPASPLGPDQDLRHAEYDPAFRFTVAIDEAPRHRWEYTSATDGVVPFERCGRVTLGDLGVLDVWWLDSYGGGIFLPMRDGSSGRETYGAGRYVLDTVKGADLGRAEGAGPEQWVVDLNFAYNPSCTYDPRWVCPLAQAGNILTAAVPVGELTPVGAP